MAAINLTAEEREKLEVREQELRELVEAEEIKRAWFASFKDWIEGIATFLDEKVNTAQFFSEVLSSHNLATVPTTREIGGMSLATAQREARDN